MQRCKPATSEPSRGTRRDRDSADSDALAALSMQHAQRRARTESADRPPEWQVDAHHTLISRARQRRNGRCDRGRPVLAAHRGRLLGDRARMATDPEDRGIYVRSMPRGTDSEVSPTNRRRDGLMRAIYDLVLVESSASGVGGYISFVADTCCCAYSPAPETACNS